MSKIRSKDTKAEVKLRRELWSRNFRYRKNYKNLPGSPDIAFTKVKLAVFVDGDFWHGNNWRLRGLRRRKDEFAPEKREYWMSKIQNNIKRDRKNNAQLKKMGWRVLRFWESDIKKDIYSVANQVERVYCELKAKR